MNIEYIVLHHTGGSAADPLADTSHHTFDIIKNWHVNGNGWTDIGYNFVIEKLGKTVAGRKVGAPGAHAVGRNPKIPDYKGMNGKSIGIVLAGNFDSTKPTTEQLTALTELIAKLRGQYPSIKAIVPHRDVDTKTCPGKNFTDKMIADLLVATAPKPVVAEKTLVGATIKELVEELSKRV